MHFGNQFITQSHMELFKTCIGDLMELGLPHVFSIWFLSYFGLS